MAGASVLHYQLLQKYFDRYKQVFIQRILYIEEILEHLSSYMPRIIRDAIHSNGRRFLSSFGQIDGAQGVMKSQELQQCVPLETKEFQQPSRFKSVIIKEIVF